MPRKGENIYKRKDGRWEGRYILSYDSNGKAKYAYIYGKSYNEVKKKLNAERISTKKIIVGTRHDASTESTKEMIVGTWRAMSAKPNLYRGRISCP